MAPSRGYEADDTDSADYAKRRGKQHGEAAAKAETILLSRLSRPCDRFRRFALLSVRWDLVLISGRWGAVLIRTYSRVEAAGLRGLMRPGR